MPDANGWKPIHEAARGGQTQVLEYLVAQGVNVNERTHQGLGASPLWWAQRNFADNHPAIQFLQKQGAVALPPIPKEERA
jgi:ankyrin repeat protein